MKKTATLVFMIVLTASVSVHANPQPGQPAKAMPSAAKSPDAGLSGKVVETMNGGGYTYVCIEQGGKKTWVAVPETQVKVGQQIAFQPGADMKGFNSKALNRTFDSIIFSGGIANGGGGSPTAAMTSEEANHPGSKATKVSVTEKISVDKAKGADAYTVGEVFAQRSKLNNKTAVVKAKVVKVSMGIMGKNWLHLQDGTGEAAKGTNDLVATTDDQPSVGDVVTVKGKVSKDKDFGAGYKYDVIMEQAKIQK